MNQIYELPDNMKMPLHTSY